MAKKSIYDKYDKESLVVLIEAQTHLLTIQLETLNLMKELLFKEYGN